MISGCVEIPILSSNNRILLHLDPDKLSLEAGADVNAGGLYNSGTGRRLPGMPNGDRVIVRGFSGGEPRVIDVALTGRLPGSFGLPDRNQGDGEDQLFCHTGRAPQAFSAWIPAEDTRTEANGKFHTFLLGVGAAWGQRVRFRFSNSRYDSVHPFFKNVTDGLFLEWKGGRWYAYERTQSLTDDVSELLELGPLHMSRHDQIFRTNIVGVKFDTRAGTCSVVVAGKETFLESSHCDPGGSAINSLAIESFTRERNSEFSGGPAYPTAFCLSTLQIHSTILE